ncbi:MAG: OB-fold domain-containing protein [Acidimicrobiales bacterium]
MATDTDLDQWIPASPEPDPDSEPFWEAAQELRLVAQCCDDCRALRFPPSPLCSSCHSWNFAWVDLPPVGTVHSWIVVTHPVSDSFQARVPYVVAMVDVAAGVRIPSRLVGVTPDDVSEGLQVGVVFLTTVDGLKVPAFGSRQTDRP